MNMGVKCDHTESIHACLMTWCRWQVEIRPAITAVPGKKLSFYYKTYDEEWTLMWQTIKRRGWSNCTRRTVIKQKEQNTCVMHHHHFEPKTENACILSIHLHDNLKHIVKTAVKNASDHSNVDVCTSFAIQHSSQVASHLFIYHFTQQMV